LETLSSIFYFLIVIGVLVTIHELGHFLAARMTGMRTDIFSFGMGKRLFGFNTRTGFTFGELPSDFEFDGLCDYRVCLLPIGGYVKVAGMVDESFDNEFANAEPQSWEFRSKNTFQKIFVLAAGVIMNMILAIAIFAHLNYHNGASYFDTTDIAYVKQGSAADIAGLQIGDKVRSINGEEVSTWQDFARIFSIEKMGNERIIEVERNNQTQKLNVDGGKLVKAFVGSGNIGAEPAGKRVVIGAAIFDMPAQQAGIEGGDTIVAINDKEIATQFELMDSLKANKSKEVSIMWKRSSELFSSKIIPNSDGLIGVQIGDVYIGKVKKVDYGFGEAFALGYEQSIGVVSLLWRSLSQIFAGNIAVKDAIGGPIMIAKQSGEQGKRGIESFLVFIAQLSVTLAFFNILPIPALDGGHIVVSFIEGIIRRELPLKIKMAIQNVGVLLLLAIMVGALILDIFR